MKSFVCNTECFYEGRRYIPGDGKVIRAEKKPSKYWTEWNRNPGDTDDDFIVSQIREALKTLDPKNDDHWTRDGKPMMKVLEDLLGFDVSRAKIEQAFPRFNRDTIPLSEAKSDFMG